MTASFMRRLSRKISPVWLAILMALLLVLWLLLGDTRRAQEEAPAAREPVEASLPRVETRWSQAQASPREQVLQGQLLPWQSVRIMAQVAGRVEQLLKQQGDRVTAGEALLELSDEGRRAQLAQAQAIYRLRQSELASTRKLKASNFASETELLRLESELARAQADLRAAELAVAYNRPEAPFSGLVDRRHVEPGELVQPGAELMTLVKVDQLKASAQIPQQDVGRVAVGQPVRLHLLDGRTLAGEVRFISQAADPQTRSFYVEVVADNPELWRVAGASVTLHIELAPVMAHRISPALLSLAADGQLGVSAVDEQGIAVNYPVQVVSMGNDGAVVSGLPERVRLITRGAGFVAPGQPVEAVEAAPAQPASAPGRAGSLPGTGAAE